MYYIGAEEQQAVLKVLEKATSADMDPKILQSQTSNATSKKSLTQNMPSRQMAGPRP